MKAMKKLTAALLAAVMAIAMVVPAFAEDQYSDQLVDPSKEGSITIKKWLTTEHTDEESGEIVEDKEPLEGVTFELYQVATLDTSTANNTAEIVFTPVAALQNAHTALYGTSSKLVITAATKYDDIKAEIADALDDQTIERVGAKQTTGADGIAKFEGIYPGIYMVVETRAPQIVTERTANFLVSIPMQDTAEGANTKWVYDIYTEPKNEAVVSGGVMLKKQGNERPDELLKGVEFVLQKQNADKPIMKEEEIIGYEWDDLETLTTNEKGEILVEGLTQGKYRFAEIDRGFDPKTNNDLNTSYIIDKGAVYEFELIPTADKSELLFVSNYAGQTLDMSNLPADLSPYKSLEMVVNNYKPDMEKFIWERTEKKWTVMSDYSVGDTIPYRITVDIPKNVDRLNTFVVTDIPTNVLDDAESVTLPAKMNEEAYKVEAIEETGGFRIVFDTKKLVSTDHEYSFAGKQIEILYDAVLLDEAYSSDKHVAENTATLRYSNEIYCKYGEDGNPEIGPDGKPVDYPQDENGFLTDDDGNLIDEDGNPIPGPDGKPIKGKDGNPDTPDGYDHVDDHGRPVDEDGNPITGPDGSPINPVHPKETEITDDTVVYNFGIDVQKYLNSVDPTNKAKKDQVEFNLYDKDPVKHGYDSPLKFQDVDGTYIPSATGSAVLKTNSDGMINVRGLKNFDYYLVETKTANGYNLLTKPVHINLAIKYQHKWDNANIHEEPETVGSADWMFIKHDTHNMNEYFGDDPNEPTSAYVHEDVVNKQGVTLPTTGGMGIILFMAGGILIACGGLMMLKSVRKAG